MRKCPKCSLEVTDESKICRVCGAIMEEVVVADATTSETPAQQDPESEHSAPASPREDEAQVATRESWICSKCGERGEPSFDVCWNCGTSRDGIENPEFTAVKDVGKPKPSRKTMPAAAAGKCVRCGSQRIIPDVLLADQGQYSDGELKAVVAGNPGALIFRNRMFSRIRADICGQCGHLELRVENPEELYDHYLESLG